MSESILGFAWSSVPNRPSKVFHKLHNTRVPILPVFIWFCHSNLTRPSKSTYSSINWHPISYLLASYGANHGVIIVNNSVCENVEKVMSSISSNEYTYSMQKMNWKLVFQNFQKHSVRVVSPSGRFLFLMNRKMVTNTFSFVINK